MKIAVYCITKNEEQFIQRWADSARDADYLVVADTGSTDDTVKEALEAGCRVHIININPWRFDDARNASMALIPADADYCIALDADEVLVEGWRARLEEIGPSVTRPVYNYTWSWNEDGSPGLTYMGDKIHTRRGYRWRHPVHEALTPTTIDELRGFCGLEIHHHPDNSKSRSQYLPLLELAVQEDPTDDRNAHYLAREYFYQGRYAIAAEEFKRHLALPKAKWTPERAKSMRLLATCYPHETEMWLLRAAAEDPNQRESWITLAKYYESKLDWATCHAMVLRALSIGFNDATYIREAESWGWFPQHLAALSAYNLGLYAQAVKFNEEAMRLSHDSPLTVSNMKWYLDALV